MMNELLKRYTLQQLKVIEHYWDTVRWTRGSGKISINIKKTEMEYWLRFEPEVVIEALQIHISKYPYTKEHYTRGIMRNIKDSADAKKMRQGVIPATYTPQQPEPKRNRFSNFAGRNLDHEILAHLELLQLSGELTAEKIAELKADRRYESYLT